MTDASIDRRQSSRLPLKQRSQSKSPDVQAPASYMSSPASASTKVTEAKAAVDEDEAPSSKRSLRKRKAAAIISDPVEDAMKPMTCVQRQSWNGWIELESDPVSVSHHRASALSCFQADHASLDLVQPRSPVLRRKGCQGSGGS